MSKICDRSPCDNLLNALGNYIFGSTNTTGRLEGFIISAAIKHPDPTSKFKFKKKIIEIEYCPFCGTRIEEIQNMMVIERFMRPRKRRRSKYSVSV